MYVEDRPVTFDTFPIGPSVEYATKVSPVRETTGVSYLQPSDGVAGGSMVDQLFGVRRGTRAVLFEEYPTDNSPILFGMVQPERVEGYVEGDADAATLWRAMKHMVNDATWKGEANARIAGESAG